MFPAHKFSGTSELLYCVNEFNIRNEKGMPCEPWGGTVA